MEKSEQINELAGALAKAQAQIATASKDKVNPHFKSKYADLSSVWDACREALSNNQLSVVQMPTDAEAGRVALITMIMHSSGQYIKETVSTRIVKDDPQGIGSALTYLRRYSLAAFVGVVADEDDDGNAASQQPQRAQAPRQEQPAAFDRDSAIAKVKALAGYSDETYGKQLAACKTQDDYRTLYRQVQGSVVA